MLLHVHTFFILIEECRTKLLLVSTSFVQTVILTTNINSISNFQINPKCIVSKYFNDHKHFSYGHCYKHFSYGLSMVIAILLSSLNM